MQFSLINKILIMPALANQNTCINQRPLVKMGDQVTKGDIIKFQRYRGSLGGDLVVDEKRGDV